MKIGTHDLSEKVFIIAEVGNNHEGNISLAKDMIWAAKETGVDAVKFQTFQTEHYISKHDTQRFKRLKSFELGEGGFYTLAEEASKAGLIFLSTPFDMGSVDFLDALVPAFKISSADNNFFPLLEHVAHKHKPVLLSTGFADIRVVQDAVDVFKRVWGEQSRDFGLCLMHCVAHYPAEIHELNLNAISLLRSVFGYEVGYSDHSLGIEAGVLSVAVGARVLEKHFTLNKNQSDFRDHKISTNPAEMRALVTAVRHAELALGTFQKKPQDSELQVIDQLRRYIAVVKNMVPGDKITQEDITWVRGAGDFPAGKEAMVFGQELKLPVCAGDFLRKSHF